MKEREREESSVLWNVSVNPRKHFRDTWKEEERERERERGPGARSPRDENGKVT